MLETFWDSDELSFAGSPEGPINVEVSFPLRPACYTSLKTSDHSHCSLALQLRNVPSPHVKPIKHCEQKQKVKGHKLIWGLSLTILFEDLTLIKGGMMYSHLRVIQSTEK